MKEFLKSVEERTIMNLIVTNILYPNENKENEGDSDMELDYEDEMRSLDLDVFDEVNRDINSANKRKENDMKMKHNEGADLKENINDNAYNRNEEIVLNVVGKTPFISIKDKSKSEKVKEKNYSAHNLIKNSKIDKEPNEIDNENLCILTESDKYKKITTSESIPTRRVTHFTARVKEEFVLTENDMRVLNKIFSLSYFIIIVALVIVALVVVLRGTSISSSPDGTIAIISFAFLFEAVSIVAIFYLFVRDIENKEYDNLKVIGEVRI